MASTQTLTADFPVSKNRLIILSFSALSRLFLRKFLIRNVAFTSRKKVFALRKFEMAMKQPTFSSLHFKYSSSDQDKPSQSTSGENTDTGSRRFLTLVGPRQHNVSF